MLFTLAAVVFFAAIVTFFSQEFLRLFKKVMAIRGAMLILPLLAASCLILTYDYWALWVVSYYRELLTGIVRMIAYLIPLGRISYSVASILILTTLSVVPVFCFDCFFYRKKNYKPYPHSYLVSTIIWLVNVLTLIVL